MSQHHVRDAFHKERLVNLTDLSQRYCNASDSTPMCSLLRDEYPIVDASIII